MFSQPPNASSKKSAFDFRVNTVFVPASRYEVDRFARGKIQAPGNPGDNPGRRCFQRAHVPPLAFEPRLYRIPAAGPRPDTARPGLEALHVYLHTARVRRPRSLFRADVPVVHG